MCVSVCVYWNCRYLPPEIGCLKKLEYLDLSFNKMKTLPVEISYLEGLISMKVANNKLVELPSAMSSLSRLESLDLSNNRLTSLGSLELSSMHRLQKLNLQVPTYDLFHQVHPAIVLFCPVSVFFWDGVLLFLALLVLLVCWS